MIGIQATASTPTLDAWRAKLAGGVAQRIATRSAQRMQLRASATAPYDTGALSQSLAVQTATTSDYQDRIDTVGALNPGAVTFPEPAAPPADSATVTSVVEYASFVNGGTLHQAAQPFWDAARVETEAALGADAEAEWRV